MRPDISLIFFWEVFATFGQKPKKTSRKQKKRKIQKKRKNKKNQQKQKILRLGDYMRLDISLKSLFFLFSSFFFVFFWFSRGFFGF